MIKTMSRMLVVAAHPDDEVLGCGATIAAERARGTEVRVVILADGITARYAKMNARAHRELQALYRDAIRANAALGLQKSALVFGKFPDMGMNAVPFINVVRFIKRIAQEFRPDVVYTHHAGDYNVDHRVAFDATLFASRPCAGEHAPSRLYSFEVPSSTEWAYQVRDGFRPTVYRDVARTIRMKIEAMKRYRSEVRVYPHPRSPEALDILARKRGVEVNMTSAEAFELIRDLQR